MTEISSASAAYCLLLFLVCLLVLVLYFCEFSGDRDEMSTDSCSKGSVLTVLAPFEGYKSKLLSRRELPWPLHAISRNYKLRRATGNAGLQKELSNCSLEIVDVDDSEISEPDKAYARS